MNDDALMAAKPARTLSEYNLFNDPKKQTPNAGVVPYDLITPLFTDYASKYRFVYVPAGKTAEYRDREVIEFPLGTTLIKTFAYPADLRRPDETVRIIETRLLIRQENGWKAWPYVWDEDLGDARLKVAGKRLEISVTDHDGAPLVIDYAVPNANQCKGCHALNKEITPIGPSARNLNSDYPYDDGTDNQLAAWTDRGILSGVPQSGDIPRATDWQDASQPLEARARSYLDVNCAHCHRLEGPASNSGLFLTAWENDPPTWGYRKRPVAAGRGSGNLEYDIDPGNAAGSILIYRMKSLDPGIMMPELGRSMAHKEALIMLEEWINGLD
ncbi:SO2930 family diheme c-type cytochrome [Hoeflea sp. TYP-13]|uniref:SO2930 family diheme c-type cytochrome n=1 Tax=Hoeflea sp. TYP-13 TaxID=3230023 RepID=UPI0034C6A106